MRPDLFIASFIYCQGQAVFQAGAVPGIGPDCHPAAIIEIAHLGMALVGVNPADLPGLHNETWECENMAGGILKRPTLQLDGMCILIADLDIFIRLLVAAAVGDDRRDDDFSGWGGRRSRCGG